MEDRIVSLTKVLHVDLQAIAIALDFIVIAFGLHVRIMSFGLPEENTRRRARRISWVIIVLGILAILGLPGLRYG